MSRRASEVEAEPTPLFRAEVLAARREQWLGTVLLAPRLSHRLFAAFALAATAALVAALLLGEYSRKARLSGWLVPREGLVAVFAPPAGGVVVALHVAEGQEVSRGEALAVLSAEVESAALGATRAEVVRRLLARRASLAEQHARQDELAARRERSLAARLEALEGERVHLRREVRLQRDRATIAERTEAHRQLLHREGLAPTEGLLAAAEDRLAQAVALCALERQEAGAERERVALEGELAEVPLQVRAEAAALEREVAAIDQELAEVEARREVVVTAPRAGTVTAVQAVRGGRPHPDRPLLTIVPAGTRLEAHLFAPSRAAGFLRVGQRVLLRYDAFPYQKFGHQDGVVAEVSRTALDASDVPAGLGPRAAAEPGEPVYRVTVHLVRQEVTAYGRPVALQPGLQLEADVPVETRRLYEWVLDPLYTLTGRRRE